MSNHTHRSILVTGGAGFIGSHLVEALVSRRARVTVVDNVSTGRWENLEAVLDGIDTHNVDLQRDDLRPLLGEWGFDTIFHLAGHANVPDSVQNPRQDFEKNVLATLNLLEATRDSAPQAQLIFTSSAAVYGEGYSERLSWKPFREDDPTVPVAPYGVSKLASERYVEVYARLYGLRTASLRLFSVYGPRLHKHVVYDLIRKVYEKPSELFIHGDGTQVRDLNHVMNAVEALLVVAERAPLQGEVYNAASGAPISIKDLAQRISEAMGVAPRFVYSGDVGAGVSQRWVADISRLKSLGYHPQLALAEGLRDTVSWFRSELGLR